MFSCIEEVLRYIIDEKVEMVDLRYTDLVGRMHHVTVPGPTVNDKTFTAGVAFDSSSVPGFKSIAAGDMVVIADVTTGRMEPFYEAKTLAFTCDVREADTLAEFPRDPRTVLKKAVAYLNSLKIADGASFSPEYEFNIFEGVRYNNSLHTGAYEIISSATNWANNEEEDDYMGHKVPHQLGYHIMPPKDRYHDLRSEMVKYMMENRIRVKYHHHEVGAPGQVEIEVLFEEPLKAADDGVLTKYLLHMTALKHGKTVTFMPKPLLDSAGNGMHFHQFLHKGGKSLFYEKGGIANLSTLALQYISGLLLHTGAVMAFTNPSTNSYKRLVPGFEAPTKIFFGLANRSAAVRIPKYEDNEYYKRIEFRPGDATGNIYFAIAAQLLAGLDGIVRKVDYKAYNFGPINVNINEMPDAERDTIKSVPRSLSDAMDAVNRDREFLTNCGAFSDELIDGWREYKMQKEYYQVRNRPHPYEIELYFDL